MNPDCELYGQAKKENLIIRKTYGQPDMRYLHCREEFSERKNTPLWNGQIEAVETTGSLIARLLPKSIHAVTAKGFELKVALFVFACSINFHW